MDLIETLRSTGAVRSFTAEPVEDEVLERVLDTARFAPNGGNQQAWHVVVLKDPIARGRLRDLYVDGWRRYVAITAAGLRPWAPITDRDAEARAMDAGLAAPADEATLGEFATHLDTAPVLLVLLADLRRLAAIDRDLDRTGFVAGASIYPFGWNLLLAARAEGLGGVMTTMAVFREQEVLELVGAPEHLAVAGVLVVGHPVHQPTKLRREPVATFASVDRVSGPPFG